MNFTYYKDKNGASQIYILCSKKTVFMMRVFRIKINEMSAGGECDCFFFFCLLLDSLFSARFLYQ